MSEPNPPSQPLPLYDIKLVEKRRSPLQRLGCGMALVLWFTFLLTPCACIFLATQGEIIIPNGNVPEPESHPLLQIDLISEIDYRGFRIVTTGLYGDTEDTVCVQSNISYVLWQGEGEPATYCDCYTRPSSDAAWGLTSTEQGGCS